MPAYYLASSFMQLVFGSSLLENIANSLLLLFILFIVAVIVLEVIDYISLSRAKYTCFELTPSISISKSSDVIEQMYIILHGLGSQKTIYEKLLRHRAVISLEVVSTRCRGIKFIARVPVEKQSNFKHVMLSYMPDMRIKTVDDYISLASYKHLPKVLDFKLGKSSQFNDKNIKVDIYDPINYLVGAMTKLEDHELVAMQVVFSPLGLKKVTKLHKKYIKKHENINRSDPLNDKLSSILFRTSLRVLVISNNTIREEERITGLVSSLSVFHSTTLQPLKVRRDFQIKLCTVFGFWKFKNRLSALFIRNDMFLSVTELSKLYHFPNSENDYIEDVVRNNSKSLPIPPSLKDPSKFDVILGENHYHDQVFPIGITKEDRERHAFILGGTGNGKSTMLLYAIDQDIKSGKGVAVIDPHGDLAERVLSLIPEDRIKDVIYFNPADISHPIGLNLLELPKSIKGDELIQEQDFVTESVISLFRKIYSDNEFGGHRLEYILRNTVHTAFTVKNCTIFTVYRLLTDIKYRKDITSDLNDKGLKNFWVNEFDQAGSMQRVKLSIGVTSKLGRFLRSAATRRVLGQSKSTIDFDEIINSGKILICNFSKGKIGEDTSSLLGISVLVKLQLAVYRRQRLEREERRPFHLYVDEFQNFATSSFVQLLSEARKYKLYMTLAEQTISQQDDSKILSTILANVGTIICFRSSSPMDEELLLPLFAPIIKKGEILNLPSYNFYMRIAAEESHDPISGVTKLLDNMDSNNTAKNVIKASRENYTLQTH